MRWILFTLFLLPFAPAFGQLSSKNELYMGFLTQGEFAIFGGNRNFFLDAEYRRHFKHWYARVHLMYGNTAINRRIFDTFLREDIPEAGFLWTEADKTQYFQFRDRIAFEPKGGQAALGALLLNTNKINLSLWAGHLFRLGAQRRFQIEPSVGYCAYYFRQDGFWLEYKIQFGSDVRDPDIPDRATAISSTTRGIVWGPLADVGFRYYLRKRYSFGGHVTGGTNKYFNTFYFGGFVGFQF